MHKIPLDELQKKRAKLKRLKQFLRKKFVGINSTIDEIVDSIEAWYLMPELLSRPTILNLWGTTGVGKTELVEAMAKYLKFENKFTKVELGSSNNKGYNVLEIFLSKSNVTSGQQNIIFFDEFQNFRTIDKMGNDLKDSDYTDFWELLNDGKMATKRELADITDEYFSFTQRKKLIKNTWFNTESELSKIKAMFGLDSTIEQMSEWTVNRMQKVLNKHRFNAFTKLDCTKSLIIIAGNLDEAYEFSRQVDEVDLDADDYHKLSKSVNFLTIKKALTKRFKPEQIARLGNTHIVYPCLNRSAYTKLISRTLSDVSGAFEKVTGIEFKIDKSINKIIYDNGVFPTQGARPIFTTVREVVENHLPKIAVFCTDHSADTVEIYYASGHIVVTANSQVLRIPYEGRIEVIKKDFSMDERTMVAVHEAGHAVALAHLFGITPERIAIDAVSGGKSGFVKNPKIYPSKGQLEKQVITMLAGRASEQEFFGAPNCSAGSETDIDYATAIVCEMYRDQGLYTSISKSGYESDMNSGTQVANGHDLEIEILMSKFLEEAKELVLQHKALIADVAQKLLSRKKLHEDEFVKICKSHGMKVRVEDKIYPEYREMFNKFIKESKQ